MAVPVHYRMVKKFNQHDSILALLSWIHHHQV